MTDHCWYIHQYDCLLHYETFVKFDKIEAVNFSHSSFRTITTACSRSTCTSVFVSDLQIIPFTMGPSALISTVIRNVLEYLSTKNFGQFIIKKLDAILWTVEKPAKFCVHGSKRFETYRISPAVFWTILIILQVVRMSLSNILVKCKKHPIEAIDVMKTIQKWRRTLRTIRFGGLQKMRESDIGILNGTVDRKTIGSFD